MRTSISTVAFASVATIISILAIDNLVPGLLYSDAEASSTTVALTVPALAQPEMAIVIAPSPIIAEAFSVSAMPEEEKTTEKHVAPAAPLKKVAAVRKTPAAEATAIATLPPSTATFTSAQKADPIVPARLSIPAVGINSSVIGVGVNPKGEMDVPDGTTNDVGWYQYGVKPGALGTAVLDAHVFAAFEHLAETKVSDDIYVSGADGTQLHFRVTRVATYALATLSSSTLFAASATRDINLITCAGTFDSALGTYDHRTIVSATLVQ